MNFLKATLSCLFVGLLRIDLGVSQCDNVYFVVDNNFCYGTRDNSSTDSCVDVGIGNMVALARHPMTEEFYVMSLNGSGLPFISSGIEADYNLYKLSVSLNMGAPVIDMSEQIGDTVTTSAEKIEALAFTCEAEPRLFGLSADLISTQYLYEIDYENDGSLTQILDFDITGVETGAGFGLFYNLERERLYRIAGFPTDGYEINPYNISDSREIISFLWDVNLGGNQGATQWASYYNEDLFFTANPNTQISFSASLENATFVDYTALDSREGAGAQVFGGVECYDLAARCQDLFTMTPSVQPSSMPTAPSTDPSMMPTSDPSSMPSSDPSSMPTEMPVEAMMTTEDEVMDDTTMEPEATESSSDDPQPTLADSASKNSISFIVVFTAAFGYLFY